MAGAGRGVGVAGEEAGRPGGPADREQKLVKEGSPDGEGEKGNEAERGERERSQEEEEAQGPAPQCPAGPQGPPPQFLGSLEL